MNGLASYIPSALLFCALILLLLVSISVPTIDDLDIARVHANAQFLNNFAQFRFGIWGGCGLAIGNQKECPFTGHGYTILIDNGVTVGASWTRGLAIHPVETAVTFIAFVLSFSSNAKYALVSGALTAVAAFITLIGLAINIAFYAFTKHQFNKINVNGLDLVTTTGPGFWLTFAALLLLVGCSALFVGKRRGDSGSSSSEGYAMTPTNWLKRFRRGIY